MAKRKTVEAAEAVPVAATTSVPEPKKSTRKAADKPKSAAGKAVHKHHAKKSADVPAVDSLPFVETLVEAPVQARQTVAVSHEAVAKLAYSYWEARGHQDGFAEQDWLRAENELLKLA